MNILIVKIEKIKPNPTNPRVIKDDKFKKLVKSIQEFPQMLQLRPIVVNDEMIVLGGNMRLRACKEAGLKEVPIIKASDLTEAQQKEFIIKDNVGFGEWDWDALANEWDENNLVEWGLDVPVFKEENISDFFNADSDLSSDIDKKNKIILEYTEEDYLKVIEAFNNLQGTKEEIVFKFLGL